MKRMASKHREPHSASLAIREMQRKEASQHTYGNGQHERQVVPPNPGEDAEKLGPSYMADADVKWCSHSGKVGHFLKN